MPLSKEQFSRGFFETLAELGLAVTDNMRAGNPERWDLNHRVWAEYDPRLGPVSAALKLMCLDYDGSRLEIFFDHKGVPFYANNQRGSVDELGAIDCWLRLYEAEGMFPA